MAIIGQLIHASSAQYFTPWQGRGGNAAVFVADIIAINTNGNAVTITVQTKNTEDDDASSSDLGQFDPITSLPSNPRTKYLSGLKELVRYKIAVGGSADDNWVHMRMLAPSWLAN